MKKAFKLMLYTLKYCWDDEFGGIFYFLDIKSNSPQYLERDQKHW